MFEADMVVFFLSGLLMGIGVCGAVINSITPTRAELKRDNHRLKMNIHSLESILAFAEERVRILEASLSGRSSHSSWRTILGFSPGYRPSMEDVDRAYFTRAWSRHPDMGGSDADMKELNMARAEAKKELA